MYYRLSLQTLTDCQFVGRVLLDGEMLKAKTAHYHFMGGQSKVLISFRSKALILHSIIIINTFFSQEDMWCSLPVCSSRGGRGFLKRSAFKCYLYRKNKQKAWL